jgi:23S rRNA (cytosine1962-C5)-methyltransferase
MSTPALHLKPKHEKRARAGHPWVFSNEIVEKAPDIPSGDAVDVLDSKGAFIGKGYWNPASLIAVRILTRNRKDDIDSVIFYEQKLRNALCYRQSVYKDRKSLRLVHAEGDLLPGLVIDRYGDVLATQITTLGMEKRKDLLRQAVEEVFKPAGAILRSEGRNRQLEGLEDENATWFGDVDEQIIFDEFGVKFAVQPALGQKTGHFFDQAENRFFAGKLCAGKSVLDVYANSGGWALHALNHGADYAITIDKAALNAGRAEENARINGFADKFEAHTAEGRKTLIDMMEQNMRFGAVVLDPPAFAKTRKAAGPALRGYQEINRLGLCLVEPGGFLFTSSCSYHVQEDRYLEAIQTAAREMGRRLRIIRRGQQAPDHPVAPHIPETRYLKSYAFEVCLDR